MASPLRLLKNLRDRYVAAEHEAGVPCSSFGGPFWCARRTSKAKRGLGPESLKYVTHPRRRATALIDVAAGESYFWPKIIDPVEKRFHKTRTLIKKASGLRAAVFRLGHGTAKIYFC